MTHPLSYRDYALSALLMIAGAALFGFAFQQMPDEMLTFAIDWHSGQIYNAVQGFTVDYTLPNITLHHPPWTMPPVMVLGLLTEKASWGVLIFLYIVIMGMSIPRGMGTPITLLTLFVLVTHYWTVRVWVDGNLEILAMSGLLLLLVGYPRHSITLVAAGVLLASAKPQLGLLPVFFVGIGMLRTWDWRRWGTVALIVLTAMIAGYLWKGAEWRGAFYPGNPGWVGFGIMRTTIPTPFAALIMGSVGISTLWLGVRHESPLTRERLALYALTSMLVAPYSSNVSIMTIFVLIVPAFIAHRRWGIALFLVAYLNLPTVLRFAHTLNPDLPSEFSRGFWNYQLLVVWGLLYGWVLTQRDQQPTPPTPDSSTKM